MKRFRLTVASKILIVLVVIAVLVGAVFGAGKLGFIGNKKTSNKTTSTSVAKADDDGNVINTKKTVVILLTFLLMNGLVGKKSLMRMVVYPLSQDQFMTNLVLR